METNQKDLVIAKDTAEDLHEKYKGKSTIVVKVGDVLVEIGETSRNDDLQKIIKEYGPMLKKYINNQTKS